MTQRVPRRDPWDGDLSSPQTLNPYAYAHSQPTRFTDPSGKCIGPLIFLAPACIGAAVGAGTNLILQLVDNRPGVNWTEVGVAGAYGFAAGLHPVIGATLAVSALYMAADAYRKHPSPETAMNLMISSLGACWGLRGLGGGGGGSALAYAGGGTTAITAQTGVRQRFVH